MPPPLLWRACCPTGQLGIPAGSRSYLTPLQCHRHSTTNLRGDQLCWSSCRIYSWSPIPHCTQLAPKLSTWKSLEGIFISGLIQYKLCSASGRGSHTLLTLCFWPDSHLLPHERQNRSHAPTAGYTHTFAFCGIHPVQVPSCGRTFSVMATLNAGAAHKLQHWLDYQKCSALNSSCEFRYKNEVFRFSRKARYLKKPGCYCNESCFLHPHPLWYWIKSETAFSLFRLLNIKQVKC